MLSLISLLVVHAQEPSSYSARELSCETDALPALSGLAQAFRASYGTRVSTGDNDYYLSGIWRADLARGLLWMPHNGSHTSRRSQHVAPTWSWASIKGQVHFPSQGSGSQKTPTFLDISLEREADSHLGPVIATKLTLLAKFRRLGEVVKKAENSWYPLDLLIGEKGIGHGAFDANDKSDKGTIWMMECMFQGPFEFRDHPSALLLHNPGGTPHTYKRLGVGRLNEDSLGFFNDCEPQTIVLI